MERLKLTSRDQLTTFCPECMLPLVVPVSAGGSCTSAGRVRPFLPLILPYLDILILAFWFLLPGSRRARLLSLIVYFLICAIRFPHVFFETVYLIMVPSSILHGLADLEPSFVMPRASVSPAPNCGCVLMYYVILGLKRLKCKTSYFQTTSYKRLHGLSLSPFPASKPSDPHRSSPASAHTSLSDP